MIRVFTDMTADLFHYGHVEFLKQARALGDYLLVGVHNDDVLVANKRKPIFTMEERVRSVEGCRWADEVIPNAPWKFDPSWIEKYSIDLVVHGDDYAQGLAMKGEARHLADTLDRLWPKKVGVEASGWDGEPLVMSWANDLASDDKATPDDAGA